MRCALLALSWYDETPELFGVPARPLSIASREAIRLMGLRVLDREPAYSGPADELGEMGLYLWLHTAPLADVCDAIHAGTWRAAATVLDPDDPASLEALALWRDERCALAETVAAADYDIRPKPRPPGSRPSPAEDTPADVVDPLRIAYRLRLLMRDTRASREEALWHWPYAQALQICHAADRWEGRWTVPAMERTGDADFEGFALAEEEGDG